MRCIPDGHRAGSLIVAPRARRRGRSPHRVVRPLCPLVAASSRWLRSLQFASRPSARPAPSRGRDLQAGAREGRIGLGRRGTPICRQVVGPAPAAGPPAPAPVNSRRADREVVPSDRARPQLPVELGMDRCDSSPDLVRDRRPAVARAAIGGQSRPEIGATTPRTRRVPSMALDRRRPKCRAQRSGVLLPTATAGYAPPRPLLGADAEETSGGYEIRTREGVTPTRFPSVRPRPLGESSAGKDTQVPTGRAFG